MKFLSCVGFIVKYNIIVSIDNQKLISRTASCIGKRGAHMCCITLLKTYAILFYDRTSILFFINTLNFALLKLFMRLIIK